MEVATNSEEMSDVHFVNTRQDTLKMALYQSAQLIYLISGSLACSRKNDEVLKSTHSCIKFNWVSGYIRHGSILNQHVQLTDKAD